MLAAARQAAAALGDRDVLHAHGFRAGGVLAPSVRRKQPVVVTWHNAVLGETWRAWPARQLQRTVARLADVTLGASSDLVGLARQLGARDARLGPVAAPPLPAPSRSREQVRAAYELGDGPLVLSVGRLAPQKDYDLTLDVAGRLRDTGAVFAVAGGGPLHEHLAARVDLEGLPVRLLGRVDGVADLLGAADLALLTSTWEARALVAQEALRAGVPLVARAVGGIPELVEDAALLVAGTDRAGLADGLAAAVRTLLEDQAERARLAEAGRAQAGTWPTEADTVAQVHAVYRELLERSAPS
jgi:glycosyltransferase involved in cell wall biosynthesis